MDIVPDSLHQRTPLYMGSTELVDLAERFLAEGSLRTATP
jgi:fructose-1,6-bisphosphatase I